MSDQINPHKIYETMESHKMMLSIDTNDQLTEDAKGVYAKARQELAEALEQTEEGSKVHDILNQALADMPQDVKTDREMRDGYNKALEDLGPLY